MVKMSQGCLAAFVLAAACQAAVADENAKQAETDAAKEKQAALEKAFSEKLSGSVLVGSFSIAGKNDKPPRAERYELKSVKKLRDDYWTFTARVKYGDIDLTVPMTLKVLWAGDTPMISLTDFKIPGLGTFTARVMFYGDRYAGTWQHGKAGGHMWGTIEKPDAAKEDKTGEAKEAK